MSKRHYIALGACTGFILALLWGGVVENSLLASTSFFSNESETPSCLHGNNKEQQKCWSGFLSETLARGSVVEALDVLEKFSEESPEFIQSCHSFAHDIGERAYYNFSKGEGLAFSSNMQVCDYGFFHGFMTEFLVESNNASELGNFCASMEEESEEGKKVYSRYSCFHGIGHGSVTRHNPEEWKDAHSIIKESIAHCRSAAQTEADYARCLGGTYNGLAYGEYRTQLDVADPLKICRVLEEDELPSECFANMAAVVFNLTEHKDLSEAIRLLEKYPEPKDERRMIPVLSAMFARQPGTSGAAVKACESLESQLAYHCLRGYVNGLVQSEIPSEKERRAYRFCASEELPEYMRLDCFHAAFSQLQDFWTLESIAQSCALSPSSAGVVACSKSLELWDARSGKGGD